MKPIDMISDLNKLPIGLFSRLGNQMLWGPQRKNDGSLTYENAIIAHLCDSTPDIIAEIDSQEFVELSQKKEKVLQSFIPNPILQKEITLNGEKYVAMLNPDEWSDGQRSAIANLDSRYCEFLPEREKHRKCLMALSTFLTFIYVKKRVFRKSRFDENLFKGDRIVDYRFELENLRLDLALGIYFHLIHNHPVRVPQIVKDLPNALCIVRQTIPGITLLDAFIEVNNAYKNQNN